ncbi:MULTISPECIES: YciI family protein [unclassified Mycolicibacterium]|uniref:YciI family protein n=1 Tax=unclassified Mycolicibacterium TaxID=2636767 RepID=UPI0012DC5787|nr:MULTISPECIES: YciI family protein [unclassified Mycolicibacterium]MUL81516.1 transcription initiation protein [Mycolicibacterium sp. CBMA 329]MUL87282.1 transcription initiation protein [Mycolicibacterium sp. CBMA 331]MUM02569.1 transcription initiation protein [Mycolicibacterium sp. CBMA 334]MUM25195.1 transcription initiation protein [Mycolicibacterium sp. CBMA 295]MUM37579.1 transcription initiation protein [Mycolicibacterium sp. CBMA 247]
MFYFALLISQDVELAPEQRAEGMAAFQAFHAQAKSAIRAGDALDKAAVATLITGGPDSPVITDGPFAEGAEVACGYYVFEADNLDEALTLARGIPVAQFGAVEVWPMVSWNPPSESLGADWLALLLEPAENVTIPDSEEWERGVRAHGEFHHAAGNHILSGAPLHPPSTATTVRVRNGEAVLTDGPYVEGAEVANGYYVLRAADHEEAVKLASMIPASAVQLRQLAGVSGL